MEKDQILKDLENIFRRVLKIEKLKIKEETELMDIKGWDSLAHVNIIEEIERHFNINFSTGEIIAIKTIMDMIELIQTKF